MDETHDCGDTTKNLENDKKNMMDINLSEVYSISSLESEKVREYLKSFSYTSLENRDSLKSLSYLKLKCLDQLKLHRHAKPYDRPRSDRCNKPTSKSFSLETCLPTFQNNIEEDIKNAANSKYLRVKNLDGTTTEVTVRPIVLVHVREQTAGYELNSKRSALASTTIPQSLKNNPKVFPDSMSKIQHLLGNKKHSNILKIKRSRNCIDLSTERKLSSMETNKDMMVNPENCRRLSHNSKNSINQNMGLSQFQTCPGVDCSDQESIMCINKCLGVFPENLQDLKQSHSQDNYSITTFYRHNAPLSETSSVFLQFESNLPGAGMK